MAAFALFAQGRLPARDATCAGTGTEAEGQAEVSVHPGSPLAPATLVPLGLMAPGVVGNMASSAPAAHSFQQGCPSCHGLPTWHHLCQAVQPPVGLEGVSAAGCLGSADGPATQPWEMVSMVGASWEEWFPVQRMEEASCLPQGDNDQPGWQKESAQGSRLMVKTGHLLLLFLLTWELPEMGPPCSSVPAGVNWIWRSC